MVVGNGSGQRAVGTETETEAWTVDSGRWTVGCGQGVGKIVGHVRGWVENLVGSRESWQRPSD